MDNNFHTYRLCMGSNTPNGRDLVKKATALLKSEFAIVATTEIIKTASIDNASCLFYFNSGICLSAPLSKENLKSRLKQIEIDFGREKGKEVVTMDIDIITMDNTIVHPDYHKQYVKYLMNRLATKLSNTK